MLRLPTIILGGPTGIGKTKLSLHLAQQLKKHLPKEHSIEVISCDSVQCYSQFDIGSGKIMGPERQAIRHHLLDVVQHTEESAAKREMTAFAWARNARSLISEIKGRGNIPVIVGGTLFYLRTLFVEESGQSEESPLNDLKWSREWSKNILSSDINMIARIGLFNPQLLNQLDPENTHRLQRFLIRQHVTGKAGNVEELNEVRPHEENVMTRSFFLTSSLDTLYPIIDKRCLQMVREGLLDECDNLLSMSNYNASSAVPVRSIGYKEGINLLQTLQCIVEPDQIDLEFKKFLLDFSASSRRLARQQITKVLGKLSSSRSSSSDPLFQQLVPMDSLLNVHASGDDELWLKLADRILELSLSPQPIVDEEFNSRAMDAFREHRDMSEGEKSRKSHSYRANLEEFGDSEFRITFARKFIQPEIKQLSVC